MKLPKDEQRSDWSARPLTRQPAQLRRRRRAYLIPLAERLERELSEAKRRAGPRRSSRRSCRRRWPEREFDKLGYLRIKGARKLDPKALSVLRELYLVRDRRAREIDRPPFKVLGNRTLLEIAERRPANEARARVEIKGVTELILRRFGREILAAVRARRENEHGPMPRLQRGGRRRRMDRHAERRLARAEALAPERAQRAGARPRRAVPERGARGDRVARAEHAGRARGAARLKGWFARCFGSDVLASLATEPTAG